MGMFAVNGPPKVAEGGGGTCKIAFPARGSSEGGLTAARLMIGTFLGSLFGHLPPADLEAVWLLNRSKSRLSLMTGDPSEPSGDVEALRCISVPESSGNHSAASSGVSSREEEEQLADGAAALLGEPVLTTKVLYPWTCCLIHVSTTSATASDCLWLRITAGPLDAAP